MPFTVETSGVPEEPAPGVAPAEVAVALALAKARAVAARLPGGPAVVLGADTLVVLEGRLLGKPGSRAEARAMLRALRGRTHTVVTGVAAVEVLAAPVAADPSPGSRAGRALTAAVESRVTMRPYGDAEIEAYVATGEPDDKAGAYAVQGEGARLVAGVEGCHTNVVGLPLRTTARLIRALGVPAGSDAGDPDALDERAIRGPGAPGPGRCGPP